jgi:excinuclease ABC subunit C
LQSLDEKQTVSDTTGDNTDIIGVALSNGRTQVVVLNERGGKVLDEQSFSLRGEADTEEEVLSQFLPQYYGSVTDFPDTVIVTKEIEDQPVLQEWLSNQQGKRVEVRVPERGKKAQLLTMAQKNAEEKLQQQAARWEAAAKNIEIALEEL